MRLTAGLLTHNSKKFASRCLESLTAQEGLGELGKDWQIVCLDNASNDVSYLTNLQKEFPQTQFLFEEENLGFSKGHNRIMQKFPADFHAVLNIDVLFSPDFLAKLLNALEAHPKFGSATGKLLYWDLGGHPEKTNTIDSCGMHMSKGHAFTDRGQGQKDSSFTPNAFDAPDVCFGGTGAATVYRRASLEDVTCHAEPFDSAELCHAERSEPKTNGDEAQTARPRSGQAHQDDTAGVQTKHGQFFDEKIFMYKEDIDLAYRLMSKGHFCLFVPEAIAWHARTTQKPRFRRSKQERIWSAANESYLLHKHTYQWSLTTRLLTWLRQRAKWTYLLLFEPKVFFGAKELLKRLEEK